MIIDTVWEKFKTIFNKNTLSDVIYKEAKIFGVFIHIFQFFNWLNCLTNYLQVVLFIISILFHSFLLGVMISFMVITTPSVFKTLDGENSKNFLRFIFPRLFDFCFLISAAIFFLSIFGDFVHSALTALILAISFLFNRYFLTPRINKMRDLSIAGHRSYERSFKVLHLVSVILYLLNILITGLSLILYFIMLWRKQNECFKYSYHCCDLFDA